MDNTASPEQVFSEAVSQLAAGRPQEALPRFEAIVKSGFTSEAVERGYGRALVENGQLGPGIAHLTRAVALDRFGSAARADLKVARSKVESGYGQPMAHPAEWGQRISSYARPSELGAVGVLGVLCALAARLFLREPLRKKLSLTALVFGVAVAGAGVFATSGRSLAVVVAEAELKAAPLESSASLSSLKSGMRVRVLRESGDFAEVERTNVFRGWMPVKSLERSPF
jgi:hypothetical protein